jgi:tetratricopeptide (TPR) repeat protein
MSLVSPDTFEILAAQDRFLELVRATRARVNGPKPSELDLYYHTIGLKGLKQLDEAAHFNRLSVKLYPQSRTAWHNLAATLGDLGDSEDAYEAIECAIRMGLSGLETLLIKGRVLVQLGQFEAAKTIYYKILEANPHHADTLRELSQLIWMQTGDIQEALTPFAISEKSGPDPFVAIRKSRLFTYAKRPQDAYEAIKPFVLEPEAHLSVLLAFASAALGVGADDEAFVVAKEAQRRAPSYIGALNTLFEAMAATGQYEHIYDLAKYRASLAPQDQFSHTLVATAARLVNRPDYQSLYDYDKFVRAYQLPVPKGWNRLDDYLSDLRQSLYRLHNLKAHPIDQSLRGGTQTTSNLIRSEDPAIKAYFEALKGPVDDYLRQLGQGDDPLRIRNHYDHKVYSSWSVQLKKEGYHVDHIHPEGWLSCAFYIDVPEISKNDHAREGWIRFGNSHIRTKTPTPAEHWFQPKPGWLAIFPSYMWHGTEPFSSDETRMTIASDIVPMTKQ